jgi:hypothetical protein
MRVTKPLTDGFTGSARGRERTIKVSLKATASAAGAAAISVSSPGAVPGTRATARHAKVRQRRTNPGPGPENPLGILAGMIAKAVPRPRRWWQALNRSPGLRVVLLPAPSRIGYGHSVRIQWLFAGFVTVYSGGAAPDSHRSSAGSWALDIRFCGQASASPLKNHTRRWGSLCQGHAATPTRDRSLPRWPIERYPTHLPPVGSGPG